MNFLKYRDVRHFLEETGLSVEQSLTIVEKEIEKLKKV